jgi:BMFP domain-containing protein YqiC
MQTDNRILDDLAKVATSALGTLQGVRSEVEDRMREQFERVLANMEIVTREEFDAVRAMATAARTENEELRTRLEALEAKLDKPAKKASAKKKPVAR